MKEGEKARANGGFSKLDRYFRALSDVRRRHLLYYLLENQVCTVDELARRVETPGSGRTASTDETEWKSRRTELHHQHLPLLENYSIVEYDKRSGDVSLADLPRTFETLLYFCQLVEGDS